MNCGGERFGTKFRESRKKVQQVTGASLTTSTSGSTEQPRCGCRVVFVVVVVVVVVVVEKTQRALGRRDCRLLGRILLELVVSSEITAPRSGISRPDLHFFREFVQYSDEQSGIMK